MTDDRLPRPDVHATSAGSDSEARTAGSDRAAALTGIDFSEIRTGEDTRQRGWFWHWNELHTEYGPLLQHSGIGLITSYIVWTDRREHSPYRGYAFPSLQTQAAFSGSDRAELMTINRILVALDLIEIRKETVQRIDEQGRKWRVPHNLYRVKDRGDDPHLTTRDVQRVLAIAAARNDVYRHIRHVLTPGFQPISAGNIWHRILADLRGTPLWEQLAARAAAEEARYSARSRAGHQSRRDAEEANATRPEKSGGARQPVAIDSAIDHVDLWIPGESVPAAPLPADEPSGCGIVTNVAGSNQGLATIVGGSSGGLGPDLASAVAGSNDGWPTTVAPANPKQNQSEPTTTKDGAQKRSDSGVVTGLSGSVTDCVTELVDSSQAGHGPINGAPAGNGPDRAAALAAFAEANGGPASGAVERLLEGISREVPDGAGWEWISAAIYEAVDSGSSYVAPKRIRQIVQRWLSEGRDERDEGGGTMKNEIAGKKMGEETVSPLSTGASVELAVASVGDGPEERRPTAITPFWVAEAGLRSGELWQALLELVVEQGWIRQRDVTDYLTRAVLRERLDARTFRLVVEDETSRLQIERGWRIDLEEALERLLGGSGWQLLVEVRERPAALIA